MFGGIGQIQYGKSFKESAAHKPRGLRVAMFFKAQHYNGGIMNYIGLDIGSWGKNRVLARLRRLKSTEIVMDGGHYNQEPETSQVWLKTTKTEEQVEAWFYKCKGEEFLDFVGCFSLNQDQIDYLNSF